MRSGRFIPNCPLLYFLFYDSCHSIYSLEGDWGGWLHRSCSIFSYRLVNDSVWFCRMAPMGYFVFFWRIFVVGSISWWMGGVGMGAEIENICGVWARMLCTIHEWIYLFFSFLFWIKKLYSFAFYLLSFLLPTHFVCLFPLLIAPLLAVPHFKKVCATIERAYTELRARDDMKTSHITPRTLETLIRLTVSHAKVHLRQVAIGT